MVPDVSDGGRRRRGPSTSQVILSLDSSVADAYRVLRTNLIFTSAERTGHVLVVTSANPGEGKTTTVANLAASSPRTGRTSSRSTPTCAGPPSISTSDCRRPPGSRT